MNSPLITTNQKYFFQKGKCDQNETAITYSETNFI